MSLVHEELQGEEEPQAAQERVPKNLIDSPRRIATYVETAASQLRKERIVARENAEPKMSPQRREDRGCWERLQNRSSPFPNMFATEGEE